MPGKPAKRRSTSAKTEKEDTPKKTKIDATVPKPAFRVSFEHW